MPWVRGKLLVDIPHGFETSYLRMYLNAGYSLMDTPRPSKRALAIAQSKTTLGNYWKLLTASVSKKKLAPK
jgi:hypothetical protein